MFVVFEGGEGVGKTTQIGLAAKWLAAKYGDDRILTTRAPGGTIVGSSIRRLLLEEDKPIMPMAELLLYGADRAQHVRETIDPALNAGKIVLCDRFSASTIAYQGYGRGLDLAAIRTIDRLATGGIVPDLTIWLDLDVELALARVRSRGNLDRLESEDMDFHHRIRRGFSDLAVGDDLPDTPLRKPFVRIDAADSPDIVGDRIQEVLTAWILPNIC
jgi:dTMP kinase